MVQKSDPMHTATGGNAKSLALLIDFGGVIVDAPKRPSVPAEFVDLVHRIMGDRLDRPRIEQDLIAADRSYARWRDEVSALGSPVELGHQEVWERFVTAQWPADLHSVVQQHATALSYAWALDPGWAVRPGIRELLDAATAATIPVAVVSNTICGAAHRDYLDQVGLTDRFAFQFYSDEIGARKPNPEMAWHAARALGVEVGGCWFIGDSVNRDIACARRAGVGTAILMHSARTARETAAPDLRPDATVDDGHGVLTLLRAAGLTPD